MKTFMFLFEELPLVIHNGIEAALVEGAAEIYYNHDGDWHTGDIFVEGFGPRNASGKRTWPLVPAGELAPIIVRRIENQWFDKVLSGIAEQIEEDRQIAADDAADMRRDHARGL